MSEKPKYDGEIPWDRMSPEDAAEIAKIKAKGGVRLNMATGVTALIISVVSIVIGQLGKSDHQKQITTLFSQVQLLSSSNATLVSQLHKANSDLTLVREQITQKQTEIESLLKKDKQKEEKIDALLEREKQLLARIEELESKIKKS